MNNELPKYLSDSLDRAFRAKRAIMSYPYYSDETRAMWLDAINESFNVQKQAYINAHNALEEALLTCK